MKGKAARNKKKREKERQTERIEKARGMDIIGCKDVKTRTDLRGSELGSKNPSQLSYDIDCESEAAISPSASPTDVELCQTCRGVFYSKKCGHSTRTYRIIDVISSIRAGCGFCKVIRSALDVTYNQNFVQAAKKPGYPAYEKQCLISNKGDRLLLEWDVKGIRRAICEILMIPTNEIPRLEATPDHLYLPDDHVDRLQSSGTSSSSSLDLANAWLENCEASHPLCLTSGFERRCLPARLLRIEVDGLVLCNGCDIPLHTPYVTLSHRWGDDDTQRLTHAFSLQTLRIFTRIGLLLTFQHAVIVAERLGVRHLWIDSLCIIQDSHQDRDRECARTWEV